VVQRLDLRQLHRSPPFDLGGKRLARSGSTVIGEFRSGDPQLTPVQGSFPNTCPAERSVFRNREPRRVSSLCCVIA
jgi:hypothetical protein